MIEGIIDIIFLISFFALAIPALYFFIMAIAGRSRQPELIPHHAQLTKIAVLIPAYKEDAVIVDSCRSVAMHNYPAESYQVFVAAHGLMPETLQQLEQLPITVIGIESEFGSKALSLQTLLNSIDERLFDLALVLDADNVLSNGALQAISDARAAGHEAIQLHRTAKNEDTELAYLEGLSEEINNNLFRSGPRALGLSASTIGSGMAFPTQKLKEIYNTPGIIYNPACDRFVDFEMMRSGVSIEYLPDVLVYDEKVSSLSVFKRQRLRWIESQLIHIKLFIHNRKTLNPASIDVWNKFISNLFPPRIVILGLLVIFNLFYLVPISGNLEPERVWWQTVLLIYVAALLLSIPSAKWTFRLFKAVIYAPVTFVIMIASFFKAKPERKEFIRTPKQYQKSKGGL